MSLMNMQNAIGYASRWTRDAGIQRRVQELGQALTEKGERASVYIPGAADNRYIPLPGDVIEDADDSLTVVADSTGAPLRGVFEWDERDNPIMRTAHALHLLGPCAQVRAARRVGFTPRTGPSVVGEARFDVSTDLDT
jgi:hypothetical protein